jgi:hypothetical protein
MSLRGGTMKQPRRVQYASDEVATLSLAMTWFYRMTIKEIL